MISMPAIGPSLRLRFLLWASTGRWQAPSDLPAPDQYAVQEALHCGWRLRQASPRWDTVWRPHAADLARARVVLVVSQGFGMDGEEGTALLRARLREAGLNAPEPDAAVLRSAEQKRVAALAPHWSGAWISPPQTDGESP